ncbi:MAG: glycosyltransferase [Stellaceae bacterium]
MLTVLIATHNGTDTLGRTLEQFCALVPPPGGWKLLVVNNASTDRTEELVLSFRNRLPLEYLLEPRLGKPYALNTGLDHISGDLVVFADDDVLPDPDWLIAWRDAVDRYPECSIFGGAIDLLYERDPPEWLPRTGWERILFGRSHAWPEGPAPLECAFGANMAMRATALADSARFDERFFAGPLGIMGEETDLVHRLAARGYRVCFAPAARVRHIVDPRQLTWRWMLKRFYRFGKSQFTFEVQWNGRQAPEILRAPRYLIRRVISSAAMVPILLLSCDGFRIFSHLRPIAHDLGGIMQSRALHKQAIWRNSGWPGGPATAIGGAAGPTVPPRGQDNADRSDRDA